MDSGNFVLEMAENSAYRSVMRTIAFVTVFAAVCSLFTPVTSAASSGVGGVFDQLIIVIDQSFSYQQHVVHQLPASDEQQNAVSNVLKTRHDTVKNSINNVR